MVKSAQPGGAADGQQTGTRLGAAGAGAAALGSLGLAGGPWGGVAGAIAGGGLGYFGGDHAVEAARNALGIRKSATALERYSPGDTQGVSPKPASKPVETGSSAVRGNSLPVTPGTPQAIQAPTVRGAEDREIPRAGGAVIPVPDSPQRKQWDADVKRGGLSAAMDGGGVPPSGTGYMRGADGKVIQIANGPDPSVRQQGLPHASGAGVSEEDPVERARGIYQRQLAAPATNLVDDFSAQHSARVGLQTALANKQLDIQKYGHDAGIYGHQLGRQTAQQNHQDARHDALYKQNMARINTAASVGSSDGKTPDPAKVESILKLINSSGLNPGQYSQPALEALLRIHSTLGVKPPGDWLMKFFGSGAPNRTTLADARIVKRRETSLLGAEVQLGDDNGPWVLESDMVSAGWLGGGGDNQKRRDINEQVDLAEQGRRLRAKGGV